MMVPATRESTLVAMPDVAGEVVAALGVGPDARPHRRQVVLASANEVPIAHEHGYEERRHLNEGTEADEGTCLEGPDLGVGSAREDRVRDEGEDADDDASRAQGSGEPAPGSEHRHHCELGEADIRHEPAEDGCEPDPQACPEHDAPAVAGSLADAADPGEERANG